MTDYIIVGGGLAGICFAEISRLNNKSFVVITDESQNSSIVAAGLYNPVILKRFSLPMDSQKHLDFMKPFYRAIEQRLKIKFDHEIPIYRRFVCIEEQNDWFIAADKPQLSSFLSTDIKTNSFDKIDAPYGFGEVKQTGFVDTEMLITAYQQDLINNDLLLKEAFDYSAVKISDNQVEYKSIIAKHIIFADGYGIKSNPYFNYLPLDGTKGELLVIKSPELKLDVSINSGIFILPLGNDVYKVGATYEWDDKTDLPTEKGKRELLDKLEEIILCNYEILHHYAGIRPTVKDRKCLIGTHPVYKNVHLLNGLGTRGVMLGPAMAHELFNAIENSGVIDRPVNLERFKFAT